jgi:ribonuclease VapC
MIVVDASALVAIGDLEPEAEAFTLKIIGAPEARIASVNLVEAGLILIGRGRFAGVEDLDAWIAGLGLEVDAHSVGHGEALAAYMRYGRGYHPAKLNLGDSFAYALAKKLDAPLLYKGDDFSQTDIRPAL